MTLEATRNGCNTTSTKSISIIRTPTANFSTPQFICEEEYATVTYNGNAADSATYEWNFDGGTIISGEGKGPFEISWNSFGEKAISLIVHESGCSSDINESQLTYYPTPTAKFDMIESSCHSDTVDLKYSGQLYEGLTLKWNLDGAVIIENIKDSLVRVQWPSFGMKNVSLETFLNDCSNSSAETIQIIKSPTAQFSAPESICNGQSAIISYLGNGADTAVYNWDFDNGIIVSGNGSGPYEIRWETNGTKDVSLGVSENGCNSETFRESIIYNSDPVLLFEKEASACYNDDYEITFTGSNYDELIWDFDSANVISGEGVGPYELNWNTSGTHEITVVAIKNGCSVDSTFFVDIPARPYVPDICMVTTNHENARNELMWSYISNTVTEFGIYRETHISEQYELLAYVPASQNNNYIDDQSSPAQRAYKYRISSIDSCGTETELSSAHRTIHLTINEGVNDSWNLIWNEYLGFDFDSYGIYRSTNSANFELVTELAKGSTSFTDIGINTDDVAYQIRVTTTDECGQNEVASKSNTVRSRAVLKSQENLNDLNIYPNPAIEYIEVNTSSAIHLQYAIYSITGQELLKGSLVNSNQIDIKNLTSGTYFISLSTKGTSVTSRFIKD